MATLLITNLGVVSRPKPCGCRERIICLQVKKVEGFLTGARHPRDGVAVSQGEAKLHVDLLGSLSGDPVGAKPVVLVGLHHVANLESVDGTVVLIHLRDGIPLNRKKRRG